MKQFPSARDGLGFGNGMWFLHLTTSQVLPSPHYIFFFKGITAISNPSLSGSQFLNPVSLLNDLS